ncbi:hypothetical protein ACWNF2_005301, partial [Escherichia coli]
NSCQKSQQAERPVFTTTSAFTVLTRFSDIKKTTWRWFFLTLPSRTKSAKYQIYTKHTRFN